MLRSTVRRQAMQYPHGSILTFHGLNACACCTCRGHLVLPRPLMHAPATAHQLVPRWTGVPAQAEKRQASRENASAEHGKAQHAAAPDPVD